MKKYQVKIEDTISTQSFTLDELLEVGLLDDYDENIMVRAVGESQWRVALEYPYAQAERTNNEEFIVNDDGTVTRKNRSTTANNNDSNTVTPHGYSVDEYGQVVRRRAPNTSRLDLSTESLSFTSSSEAKQINVTTNGNWNISLQSASWVHLTKNRNCLQVRVDSNSSSNSRTDYFKLKSGSVEKTINIYQSGKSTSISSGTTTGDDGDGCVWIIAIVIGVILFAIFG